MKGLSTSSYKELKSLDLSCNVMKPEQILKVIKINNILDNTKFAITFIKIKLKPK